MNTDARKQKILTKNGDFQKGEFDRHQFFEIRTSPPLLSKKCSNFTLSPPKNLKIIYGPYDFLGFLFIKSCLDSVARASLGASFGVCMLLGFHNRVCSQLFMVPQGCLCFFRTPQVCLCPLRVSYGSLWSFFGNLFFEIF